MAKKDDELKKETVAAPDEPKEAPESSKAAEKKEPDVDMTEMFKKMQSSSQEGEKKNKTENRDFPEIQMMNEIREALSGLQDSLRAKVWEGVKFPFVQIYEGIKNELKGNEVQGQGQAMDEAPAAPEIQQAANLHEDEVEEDANLHEDEVEEEANLHLDQVEAAQAEAAAQEAAEDAPEMSPPNDTKMSMQEASNENVFSKDSDYSQQLNAQQSQTSKSPAAPEDEDQITPATP